MTNQVCNTVMIPVEEYEALRQKVEELENNLMIQTESCKQLGRIAREKGDERIYFRDQLAAMTQERDRLAALVGEDKVAMDHHIKRLNGERNQLLDGLAASQADNARLRDDLRNIHPVAHRLALELECLLLDTKDMVAVSKWWDSGHEALEQWRFYIATEQPLATTPDHSALSARLAQERERCAQVCEELFPDVDYYQECAAAIRGM